MKVVAFSFYLLCEPETMEQKLFEINHERFEVRMETALECLDIEMCNKACESCSNFGKSWACPPFREYDFPGLHPERFENLIIFVSTLHFRQRILIEDARKIFNKELYIFMPQLRQEAQKLAGIVYGFACSCDLCRSACTRTFNKPCRHANLIGPSLEAAGFNVSKLLSRFCGNDLKWSQNGYAPREMRYVSAIAY